MGRLATHRAARHEWDDESEESLSERILRFPRRDEPAETEPGQPARRPYVGRRRLARQAVSGPDSTVRLLVTAGAVVVAVVAVGFLLMQLGQLGRQAPPAAAPTAGVPGQVGAAPVPAPGPPQPPAAPPGQGELRMTSRVIEPSYTVAPGDTLGSIAARQGTNVEALQAINNLADRNVLSIGQKLVLPNQE